MLIGTHVTLAGVCVLMIAMHYQMKAIRVVMVYPRELMKVEHAIIE
jgi:hypothetical protein